MHRSSCFRLRSSTEPNVLIVLIVPSFIVAQDTGRNLKPGVRARCRGSRGATERPVARRADGAYRRAFHDAAADISVRLRLRRMSRTLWRAQYTFTLPGAWRLAFRKTVRVLENVRGRSVYLVQSTVFPTNANFMELLFWIDAFSRASGDSVTVVVPYFSYAKGDKKDEPRVSIRARVCADAIEAAGADRVVT